MIPVPDSLALYVHWPFCRSKCPYCDFNSHVRDGIDDARWRAALLAELDHAAARTPGRRLDSIFFGGGTPSLMAPGTVAAIIARARAHWRAPDDLEITLEANPTSVEAARLRGFRDAGVNRVSLGVQALDDDALRFLGRAHSAAEALAAVAIAREVFARVSFDLIYARPGQTVAAWEDELDRALDHAGEHLSVYQLTIEKGTPFHALHRKGAFATPDEDTAALLYETTVARLEAAGLPAYEISNHARPGAECRHNLVYWRGGDYAGIGPGAHGRLTLADGVHATETAPSPEAWLVAVETAGHAIRADAIVDAPARRDEIVMMGLRLARGIERARFARLTGGPLEGAFDPKRLRGLVAGGFLVLDDDGLRATDAGRQRLDAVLARLLG